MKKIKYIILICIISMIAFSNCQESDVPDPSKSVIKVDNENQNQFDIFLKREFVAPYNVELLYKLPDIETNLNNYVVPSDYNQSIKMANLIKYLAFEPYTKVVSQEFMQKYFPKMIVLVGSGAYNNNGTVILGTAEGGLKITLYDINNMDVTDIDNLNDRYFRTIYHEFSHILHQNIPYTRDFNQITSADYVQDEWNRYWPSNGVTSLEKGFISDYASKSPDEDFVELIAHYMTKPQSEWDTIITNAGAGGAIITQKITIVKSYLQSSWSIDLDALRDEVLLRQNNLDSQDLDNIN
ncbi:putative zinc-binding metallopeptidase [Tenacibaculum soleae]|uniref:zinc-binding metallopeptidase n=1 Tax=Tenacibaculum soleae TaxID=447689 RepID=UPI0026E2917B|nr:putative zinc-binding metallopeptidase [Tenacibaculum soleae]MDO6743371.1 putative zinc-binding metallopeptidase [Tenacibaculum soleae]